MHINYQKITGLLVLVSWTLFLFILQLPELKSVEHYSDLLYLIFPACAISCWLYFHSEFVDKLDGQIVRSRDYTIFIIGIIVCFSAIAFFIIGLIALRTNIHIVLYCITIISISMSLISKPLTRLIKESFEFESYNNVNIQGVKVRNKNSINLKNLNIDTFSNIHTTYIYTKLPLTYKECLKLQKFYKAFIDKVYADSETYPCLPTELLDALDSLAAQHAYYQTKRTSIAVVIITSLITGILTLLATIYSKDLTITIFQLLNR